VSLFVSLCPCPHLSPSRSLALSLSLCLSLSLPFPLACMACGHLHTVLSQPLSQLSASRPYSSVFNAPLILSVIAQFAVHLYFLLQGVALCVPYLPEYVTRIARRISMSHPNLQSPASAQHRCDVHAPTDPSRCEQEPGLGWAVHPECAELRRVPADADHASVHVRSKLPGATEL
jgi:hypothetical protein